MAADNDFLADIVTFLLFVMVVGAIIGRIFAWNYVKTLLASGWLTVQARVEYGSVEERHIRYITYYVARIDYSYSVNNDYYSGHFERVFFRESSAERFVAGMKGMMIFIRSNPHRPERSALLRQDQPGGWPA